MTQVFVTPLYSSDQSIDRVLNAGLPVLLVFLDGSGAPGFEGVLKSLAGQQAGRLLVVQLNMRDSQQTASRYQVHTAPAVVTIKGGQIMSKAEGIRPGAVEAHVRYLLGEGPRPAEQAGASAGGYVYPRAAQAGGVNGAAGQPVNVTDATFDQEVMRSELPVVVDFWAPWCGPCRMVAPILERLAGEMRGQVKIVKVNVDENPLSPGRFGVQAIPTMLIVKNGRVVNQWAGALPEQAMRARLARALQ